MALPDVLIAITACERRGDFSRSPARLSFSHCGRYAFDAAIILPEVEPHYR
jgi:hypothetical protein